MGMTEEKNATKRKLVMKRKVEGERKKKKPLPTTKGISFSKKVP